MNHDFKRYSKQMFFAGIGEAGQLALSQARVLVVGCGALGSVITEQLVRAGIGYLRIVDRDFVELSNLQRQVLFDENDVREHQPKAIAAAEKLKLINSQVKIDPFIMDVAAHNIGELTKSIDLIVDGTDNFETRYLINDLALEKNIPWVHGGCLGASGQVMTIIPHVTPCLRCLMPEPPVGTELPTCDTAGVISPIIQMVTSLQVVEVFKLFVQHIAGQQKIAQISDELARKFCRLLVLDAWEGEVRSINLSHLLEKKSCPACHQGERHWLRGERGISSTVLCGRNAVQIYPATKGQPISLKELGERLKPSGETMITPYLIKFSPNPEFVLTIFSDGRAIIQGTDDTSLAKSIYSRYIGL